MRSRQSPVDAGIPAVQADFWVPALWRHPPPGRPANRWVAGWKHIPEGSWNEWLELTLNIPSCSGWAAWISCCFLFSFNLQTLSSKGVVSRISYCCVLKVILRDVALTCYKVSWKEEVNSCFLFERMVASLSWLSLSSLQGFVTFCPTQCIRIFPFKNIRGENGGATIGLHAAQEFLITRMHFKCNRKPDGLLSFLILRWEWDGDHETWKQIWVQVRLWASSWVGVC